MQYSAQFFYSKQEKIVSYVKTLVMVLMGPSVRLNFRVFWVHSSVFSHRNKSSSPTWLTFESDGDGTKKIYEIRAKISFGDIRNLPVPQFIRKWFSPESHTVIFAQLPHGNTGQKPKLYDTQNSVTRKFLSRHYNYWYLKSVNVIFY